jgi:hypothetical protein
MYLRDVVEEARYAQDLDNYRRLFPEIDDLQAIIVWILSRQPTSGEPLAVAPDFRVFTTEQTATMPAFHILYSFDENNVYLHSIQKVELE